MACQQIEISHGPYAPTKLKYLTVHSSALKGRGNISCYNTDSSKKDLPIVVLLHGVYGNHWVWMHLGGVHQVYERLRQAGDIEPMLLVMPEDGSYYAGSGYLPLSHGPNCEAWIMEDALEAVTQSLGCVSRASKIYLCGLSMGGYGALRLGAKYASRVSGISSHSAMTSIDDFTHFVSEDLSLYQCPSQQESQIMHWINRHSDRLPPLRLDCGTEDILYPSNLRLIKQLKESAVPHTFSSPKGDHSWPYWHRQVAETLRFFNRIQQSTYERETRKA